MNPPSTAVRIRSQRLEAWLLRTATREAYRMRRLRGYEQPDGFAV